MHEKKWKAVKVKSRKPAAKKTSLFKSATNGFLYLVNVNGLYFKFVDVPGDGDCFFHSLLKKNSFAAKFPNVKQLRLYLSYTVHLLYNQGSFLRRLFEWERISLTMWCSNITCMGRWAIFFDTMMMTYVLEYPFVVVSNNLHGFMINHTRVNLN